MVLSHTRRAQNRKLLWFEPILEARNPESHVWKKRRSKHVEEAHLVISGVIGKKAIWMLSSFRVWNNRLGTYATPCPRNRAYSVNNCSSCWVVVLHLACNRSVAVCCASSGVRSCWVVVCSKYCIWPARLSHCCGVNFSCPSCSCHEPRGEFAWKSLIRRW